MTPDEAARERPGEFDLIARYFRSLAAAEGTFELLDDASTLVPSSGHDLVLSVDMLAANVHFFPEDPAKSIARKALGVNLSDLAAKGAVPIGYLVSLALPENWQESWVADFADGLREVQNTFGCQLLGGDTIRSSQGSMPGGAPGEGVQISITVIGEVPSGGMVRRGGAKPGDVLYVTGTLGDGALGLQLRLDPDLGDKWGLSAADVDHLLDRYLHPQPRLALAESLQRFARAGMDISDGFLGDLTKMARLAAVSAKIERALLPLSPAAQTCVERDQEALLVVLTGGDDYEVLVAVPPQSTAAFEAAARQATMPVTRIGRFEAHGSLVQLLDADGAPLERIADLALDLVGGSFAHF